MCQWGDTVPVCVVIPADLSCTGKARWREKQIDSCIADLVRALQRAEINMRGSCCGHGKTWGSVGLWDGRVLVVTDESCSRNPVLWALRTLWQAVRWKVIGHREEINRV